ncbi:MAG: ribosomal protein L7/L12, partial [Minisyncoccales bacterium]
KNLVDSISDEPQVIAESVPTDEAKEMKDKIEEAGATVELK